MGKIFYVMGKSSSGKDTIYNMLIKDDDLKLKTLVGYTTRPMREGEKNGHEYFFVSEKRLFELQEQGKVIECRAYDTVYGKWYYFTVDDEQVHPADDNYVLIGTLESFAAVRNYYGCDDKGEKVVCPVYIHVEDGERLFRALKRERIQKVPKYSEMCRRFLADSEDFSDERINRAGIDKVYENDVLSECYERIKRDIMEMLK